MKLRHDAEADAAHIRLSDEDYAFGEELDAERRIDYSADGNPVGIELLCVSTGINIRGLPRRPSVSQLLADHGIEVLAR